MYSSCIVKPANALKLVIHKWMFDYCVDLCEMMLLSFFIDGHDTLLPMAVYERLDRNPQNVDETVLFQYGTDKKLSENLADYFTIEEIRRALERLEEKGAITVGEHPTSGVPGYCLNTTVINNWIVGEWNEK